MGGFLLLSVAFLVGQVMCGVDRELHATKDVEEFQIPYDDSDNVDDTIEDAETDDGMTG